MSAPRTKIPSRRPLAFLVGATMLAITSLLLAPLASQAQDEEPANGTSDAAQAADPPEGIPASERPGPKPEPIRQKPIDAGKGPETVKVEADGSGFFDADENKATFTDNVRVDHPSFKLTADQLEVFLEEQQSDSEPTDVIETTPPSNGQPAETESDGLGIRLAVARGPRVVIHRMSDEGEMMVGVCRHATFDGKTREMILRDWPQVQKGESLIRALEQSAVIILTEDGRLRTEGRVRTELAQGGDNPS